MFRLNGSVVLKPKFGISWQDVLAPKRTDISIERAFEMALDAGYKYFYFNGEILEVDCHVAWKPSQYSLSDLRA